MFGIVLLVSNNQGQERNSLSRARRHLKDAVTPGIKGLLEIAHVGILLGVYSRVREEDGEIAGCAEKKAN